MDAANLWGRWFRLWRNSWPWAVLLAIVAIAAWHAVDFPEDIDQEFPKVARPTFSPHPPPAYRLAEPGDTIDRVAIYASSMAMVLALIGLAMGPSQRRGWLTALAIALGCFWGAANPGPTFDGWHGWGWASALNPETPGAVRVALAVFGLTLAGLTARGLFPFARQWRSHLSQAQARGVLALLTVAAVGIAARTAEWPRLEPAGYWPRWAFVLGIVGFTAALARLSPFQGVSTRSKRLAVGAIGGLVWLGLVVLGITLTWHHRPIDRLRAAVPGRIFISAMPTPEGLEVAHQRHHFKTIINLFPEDTPFQSPLHDEEVDFARRHGIRYVGSPSRVSASDEFLDETLQIAQDPNAWPILVHCHACMDRTPAWVGIYRFVIEGRPLDEIMRFIEGHRGYRPKASVTLLYNRVLERLAAERYRADPTGSRLREAAKGTVDPFHEQLKRELGQANSGTTEGVGTASAGPRPNLTPRR